MNYTYREEWQLHTPLRIVSSCKINITLKITRKSDKREEKLDLLFLVKVTIFSTFPNLVNI